MVEHGQVSYETPHFIELVGTIALVVARPRYRATTRHSRESGYPQGAGVFPASRLNTHLVVPRLDDVML